MLCYVMLCYVSQSSAHLVFEDPLVDKHKALTATDLHQAVPQVALTRTQLAHTGSRGQRQQAQVMQVACRGVTRCEQVMQGCGQV